MMATTSAFDAQKHSQSIREGLAARRARAIVVMAVDDLPVKWAIKILQDELINQQDRMADEAMRAKARRRL